MMKAKAAGIAFSLLLVISLSARCDYERLLSRDCSRGDSSSSEANCSIRWWNASHHELPRLIIHFGTKRQFSTLADIARSERCESGLAAALFLREMPFDACVKLCRSIPQHSAAWTLAIETCAQRFEKNSLPLLRELVCNKRGAAAYHTFRVCRERGWPHLIDVALCHINNPTIVVDANAFKGEQVLDEARRYIVAVATAHTAFSSAEPPDDMPSSPDVLGSTFQFEGLPVRLSIESVLTDPRLIDGYE
jgi:hypothetical protein